ncbi:MAG: GNAT family N-acetyltransferase [Desulfobacterales bacterium]|nr:GNAT family N-acetyltransferase [Desulfobacterales bacterium]
MIPTLKTKRLILRPLSLSDEDAMVETIMADMDVMHWLPYSDQVSTPEGQREVARGYLRDFIKPRDEFGFGIWAVCTGDIEPGANGRFMGYCGFIPGQIKDAGPEIAYAMGKSYWGKGFVSEALTACVDWIFAKPEITRLYAVTDNDNTASRRVMEKLGMIHEKGVDLYDSVAKGEGLLPFYSIEKERYIKRTTGKGG